MSERTLLDQKTTQICKLEHQITSKVQLTSTCYVHFIYDNNTVTIATYNYNHEQAFLLGNFTGSTRMEALNNALNYLNDTIRSENNYTVIWTDSTGSRHTSYFRGVDEEEVKSKLYCSSNNIENIQIEQIILSPIA
jgi:hypothetical protein